MARAQPLYCAPTSTRHCRERRVDLNTMIDPQGTVAEDHQLDVLLVADFYLGGLKEGVAINLHL